MVFTFRFERVLSVRRIQEETARQAHAQTRAQLDLARQTQDGLRRRLGVALEEFDDLKRKDELTPDALYLHTLHLAGLRREIERARVDLAAAQAEYERTATELSEAHKNRKSLERYREREELEWRRREARKEAKDLDEIVVSRHRGREEESHGL